MRAIVTGATGVIGIALVNKLIQNNNEVLVIMRKKSEKVKFLPKSDKIKIKYYNIDEYNKIENKQNEKYDVLYHLAWQGTTGEARNDLFMQIDNVKYSIAAVKLANRFHCSVFIGAGSQAEYGKQYEDLKSDTMANPETRYGIAKLCAGQMTRSLCNELNIKHIWTRILSVYGPYDNNNSLVMNTIRKIKDNEKMNITKCEQIWDYIYSKDVATILYLLSSKGKNNKVYVIGSGEKKQLKEYVEIIKKEINENYIITYGTIPYYENQVMYLCADTKDLKKDLDFKCQFTFEEGIKDLLMWYNKENKEI